MSIAETNDPGFQWYRGRETLTVGDAPANPPVLEEVFGEVSKLRRALRAMGV